MQPLLYWSNLLSTIPFWIPLRKSMTLQYSFDFLKIQRSCCLMDLSRGASNETSQTWSLSTIICTHHNGVYFAGLLQALEHNRKAQPVPAIMSIIIFITKFCCLESKKFRLQSSLHLTPILFHKPFFHGFLGWQRGHSDFRKILFLNHLGFMLRMLLSAEYHLTHSHLSKSSPSLKVHKKKTRKSYPDL